MASSRNAVWSRSAASVAAAATVRPGAILRITFGSMETASGVVTRLEATARTQLQLWIVSDWI